MPQSSDWLGVICAGIDKITSWNCHGYFVGKHAFNIIRIYGSNNIVVTLRRLNTVISISGRRNDAARQLFIRAARRGAAVNVITRYDRSARGP